MTGWIDDLRLGMVQGLGVVQVSRGEGLGFRAFARDLLPEKG